MPSGAHGLDVGLGQLHPLLPTQQRQQHQNPLMRTHASVQAEVTLERTREDPHLLACFEPLAPG